MLHTTLVTIPPSPVADGITVELRAGIMNTAASATQSQVSFYLDHCTPEQLIHRDELLIKPGVGEEINCHMRCAGRAGTHRIVMEISSAEGTVRQEQELIILPLGRRSTLRIDGAFTGLLHWSEEEGRLWNDELRRFEEADWRAMVRAQQEIGVNIMVIQESFRNEMYIDRHDIEQEGYQGRAYYPSQLYPGRVEMATTDAMEVILSETDQLGMHVFIPIGLYAWFDFTPGSLDWHKQVARELWQRYGHHTSFYGWYVSEEIHGNLGSTDKHREDLIAFFAELKSFCRAMSPGKPLMLAPNCHGIAKAGKFYQRLLQHLDILCPFAFHRMPLLDLSGKEAATLLQSWCDEAGAHLWLDLESFLFKSDKALYPRPIEELVKDLDRYDNFEKIIAYQYPGLLNAPWARLKPGGESTVRLYEDYQRYYQSLEGLLATPA